MSQSTLPGQFTSYEQPLIMLKLSAYYFHVKTKGMVAEKLQKSKFSLCFIFMSYEVLSLSFISHLLYVLLYIYYIFLYENFCFYIIWLCYVFIFIIFQIVSYDVKHFCKKYLYFNDYNFLCYINIFIICFSHAIQLVKYGRQFVFKILNYIIRLIWLVFRIRFVWQVNLMKIIIYTFRALWRIKNPVKYLRWSSKKILISPENPELFSQKAPS